MALVAAKASKLGPALRLAEKRLRESQISRVDSVLKFGLLLVPLLIAAVLSSHVVTRALLGASYFTLVGAVAAATWREYSYSRSLVSRIRRGLNAS